MNTVRKWFDENNAGRSNNYNFDKNSNTLIYCFDKLNSLLYNFIKEKNSSIANESRRNYLNYTESKNSFKIINYFEVECGKLPVIKMEYKGVSIILKGDFKEYTVIVKSTKDIKAINNKFIFDKIVAANDFTGIPDELVSRNSYFDNKSDFSLSMKCDSYQLYLLIFLILRRVYNFESKNNIFNPKQG